jgi:hypothetical protein
LFVSLVVRIALLNRESIGRLLAAVGDKAERGLDISDEVPKAFAGCVDGSKCAFPSARKEFLRGVTSLLTLSQVGLLSHSDSSSREWEQRARFLLDSHIGCHARSKKCKLMDCLGEIHNEFYGVYLTEQDREHLEWF